MDGIRGARSALGPDIVGLKIALASTVLGLDAFEDICAQMMFGIGGVERWIAYTVLLWLVLVGGVLMTKAVARHT